MKQKPEYFSITPKKVIQAFGFKSNEIISLYDKTMLECSNYSLISSLCNSQAYSYMKFPNGKIEFSLKDLKISLSGCKEIIESNEKLIGKYGSFVNGKLITEIEVIGSEEFLEYIKSLYDVKPYSKSYLMDLFDFYGLSYVKGQKMLENYCLENEITEFNNFYIKKLNEPHYHFNYLAIF